MDYNQRTLFPQDSICSLDGTSQFELSSNGAAINPVSGLYQQQAYFMTGSTAPLCPSSSSGLGSTNGDAPVVPVMDVDWQFWTATFRQKEKSGTLR